MSTLLMLGFLAAAAAFSRTGARRRRRKRSMEPGDDLVLLSDLVVLGLLAGMPFPVALAACARYLEPGLSAEVRRVTRRARIDGSAVAFVAAGEPLGRLLALAARAVATGAPLAAAVASFADEARNAARARALADARRLAVRLLFPLALLILPGFVVLVAGPVVLDGLARLDL